MKKLLKYLIPVVSVVIFLCIAAGLSDSRQAYGIPAPSQTLEGAYISSSTCHADAFVPVEVSSVTGISESTGSSRAESRLKVNSRFVKSGKTVDSSIIYVVQNRSVIIHSSLVELIHRLVRLHTFIV